MNLKEKTRNRIGIYGLAIFFACLLLYTCLVVAEFYTSRYGQIVNAKVIDVSDLCRPKRKRVTLLIEGQVERVNVYGLPCRQADFPLNSVIKVRKFDSLNIVTIPDNYS